MRFPWARPARIDARREDARVSVNVAANYGCQTSAGGARVEDRDGELRLFADTILPALPDAALQVHAAPVVPLRAAGPCARRVVFVKDGRVEGEGRLEPQ
jgi:hypothetical protein